MRRALTIAAIAAAIVFGAGCSDDIEYHFTPEDDTQRCGVLTRVEIPEVAPDRYYPLGRYCRQEG